MPLCLLHRVSGGIQFTCSADYLWKAIVHDGPKASEIRLSLANQARASSSEKKTNAAPALIYANLLQPEKLSLNQWIPGPSRNGGWGASGGLLGILCYSLPFFFRVY